ncbi:MAG: threonine--tRNA ligase [candidate division WOR-3 bacterium]
MRRIKVKFPNGEIAEYEFEGQKSILELVGDPKGGFVARANGKLFDLFVPIPEGVEYVEILDFNDKEGKEVFWHSSAHILAQAVKRLYPYAKLTVGPPIENGFFYDIDFGGKTLAPEDLERIEEEAIRICKEDYEVRREEMPSERAREFFSKLGEDYKVELIDEFNLPVVSVYWQGEFVDLCRGPHIYRTGLVKSFKITGVSSAYWKGDPRNPSLQRIYGISFPTGEQMKEYLGLLEEAKKRDHRVLGRELDLFGFYEEAGAGFVFWHPNGAIIRGIIEDYWKREHIKAGYKFVYTPHLLSGKLWEISGHLNYYAKNMFVFEKEGQLYAVKPMNCPAHILIYKSRVRSYRDLPIRLCELGTVYRDELSGVLHGLLRVRGFTQDDAHIFAREDQIEEEVKGVLNLMKRILKRFGFDDFEVELSIWDPNKPEEYMGTKEMWDNAINSLKNALESSGFEYSVEVGEAAFYGPKIDVKLKDALNRRWQCTTVQVDFNLPRRFEATYKGSDGKDHYAVMIHRALFGSIERFLGILIEHYAGDFPLWLAPVQVKILPIKDEINEYAYKVKGILENEGFRVEVDDRNERLNYKILDAEKHKIPYMLIVGGREMESGTVSVRKRKEGDKGVMRVEEFLQILKSEME